jgi:hypothetical protein
VNGQGSVTSAVGDLGLDRLEQHRAGSVDGPARQQAVAHLGTHQAQVLQEEDPDQDRGRNVREGPQILQQTVKVEPVGQNLVEALVQERRLVDEGERGHQRQQQPAAGRGVVPPPPRRPAAEHQHSGRQQQRGLGPGREVDLVVAVEETGDRVRHGTQTGARAGQEIEHDQGADDHPQHGLDPAEVDRDDDLIAIGRCSTDPLAADRGSAGRRPDVHADQTERPLATSCIPRHQARPFPASRPAPIGRSIRPNYAIPRVA